MTPQSCPVRLLCPRRVTCQLKKVSQNCCIDGSSLYTVSVSNRRKETQRRSLGRAWLGGRVEPVGARGPAGGAMKRSGISGWGCHVPEEVFTNGEVPQRLHTFQEWIRSRTGIRERHIAGP